MNDNCLLRDRDAAKRLGISRTFWWRKVKEGKFPQPVVKMAKLTLWRSVDVDAIVAKPKEFFN